MRRELREHRLEPLSQPPARRAQDALSLAGQLQWLLAPVLPAPGSLDQPEAVERRHQL
jgi:hypothetical protein